MRKIVFGLFAALLFFVPLVLWPFTSEVFEFNKIVIVYILTILISSVWMSRCIVERKFIFRRTLLDIPLLVFLGSQIISTLLSIDFYTSLYGYYSRFNGGLASVICYSILYWAFVSNLDKKDATKLIRYYLLPSAIIVSIYAVLEHFGIDKKIWVQDVQSRVFSTLGQPNWLAAWIVALIPITFNIYHLSFIKKLPIANYAISGLFFITLLFTKSRSGLLGFIVANIVYWGLVLYKDFKNNIKQFIIFNSLFLILALFIGTQWTPSLKTLIYKSTNTQIAIQPQGTALENGGTESGTIRKIVWQGAIDIWKHYPILGTGLETYAYSYYQYRPVAHNITSEWDFIYNKAHNEFLNMAANSGSIGLISYLVLIGFIIFIFIQKLNLPFFISHFSLKSENIKSENKIEDDNLKMINVALLAGFISLSVSNFFGFSVVPTQLEFFLFPALAVAISNQSLASSENDKKINSAQKIALFFILLSTSYLLLATYRYWYSDILYAKAKAQSSVKRPDLAVPLLDKAISYQPNQSIYYAEIASNYSTIAMAYDQAKDATTSSQFVNLAISEIEKAIALSPANVNLKRQMFGVYVRLSTIDEKYLAFARNAIIETLKLAPTDPKLYYNLGTADANLGNQTAALADFQKAVELKANYADARVQYAALLVHLDKIDEAKKQLEYILTKIDPGNTTAKQALDNIK